MHKHFKSAMLDFRNLKNCLRKTAESLPQIDAAEIQAQLSAWTEKVRQAFAFWWWVLFGWMGEKVKKRRTSIYLAVANAMVRHPRETWSLAAEMMRQGIKR